MATSSAAFSTEENPHDRSQSEDYVQMENASHEPPAKPKKKRGRPRFEIQDGSAADRRRTQIREAQRAYRQRREGTLDELRRRVSELSDMMELMNKAFMDCFDRLTASGLSAKSMQDIRETSAQFRAFMKRVREPSDQSDLETAESVERPLSTPAANGDAKASENPNFIPLDIAMLDTSFANGAEDDMAANWTDSSQDSQAVVSSASLYRTSLEATCSMPLELSPPVTYSFQESTFGRRLHRSCLEQSYQLILDPNQRPGVYQQVFELSLLRRDKSNLTSALKTSLSRGSHECLHTSIPVIHIGGAGTHYPRRDAFGNLRPKRKAYNVGVIGPQMLALLEHAAHENLTTDMTVDLVGYEGEWLDAYDVEGYLNEKGIFIDPNSSFVEIEVPASRSAASIPLRGLTESSENSLSDVSADSWLDFFQSTGNISEVSEALGSSHVSLPAAQEKKTTTIDVTRFVSLLTASRVCLGWCPGFKRHDVDRALAMSSLDAL
ncbi:hypothetical protein M409DRAFT_30349 [Zasmidium cellare ATCC 36951]|uniref:BZIP domain-containing protein n=1 Tax=Zasmidium cellare ATCC 36951 TaxID=1080233 RepID=A0A6A6BZ67_ZASCE|nr:uncharacterized protein M409DRAFT_30349 [Zasmidium cellare ATCC 36951]KAF2159210.1 hypothetical protein M409DRAFT_30349 [Zasmidium cellare ATCC 36951]